ncbi:MAG: hypothetical protein Q7K55_00510 [Candidatus Levybacteria bacterium]|nr:hypothetical protein [Candidatus Levybacteria bacterium]
MQNNPPSINLIKNRQAPLFDRFMNWALTVGRLIVILTEVIAVFTFLYRFSLDEKLIDLHSNIKQKQNIINILKNDENKYRNLQDRIALATSFSSKGAKDNKIINDLFGLMTQEVKIDNLTLNKDRLDMSVSIDSVPILTGFVESLKNYPSIKSISVDSIENRPDSGLSADITALLK